MKEQRFAIGDNLVDDHVEVSIRLLGHVGTDDVTYVLDEKGKIS